MMCQSGTPEYDSSHARHGRIESGAVAKRVERDQSALKEAKVSATSGNKKASVSQGDCCSFRHETQDRAQKPEHTAATVSEPSMSRGRSVSRKTSIRGESNQRSILRQPCRYYLRGTCTRTSCEYWQPLECQFYQTKTGCKAGDKCLFPYYKVEEQPNIKSQQELLPKKKRQRRQESSDYCEKCITIGLCITRFRCTRFSR